MKEDKAKFGNREKLSLGLLEGDLENFVRNDVYTCFQSIVEDSNEFTGEFDDGELNIDLKIESGGIVVTASYPLSMSLDGTEIFEIQDFDLFYPSNLYSFFNNAIKNPLYYEEKDVHYNYTESTLLSVSSYRILGADLEISEQGLYNIYEFTTNQIHRDEDLVYRIAVENRPPALEYVSQAACLGYDYIILPDSRSFTNLTINASAYDPDQENVSYEIDVGELDITVPDNFDEVPYINEVITADDNVYDVVLTAYNDNGYDSQLIRVKVGETTDFTVTVTDVSGNIVEELSVEEPYFVTVETDDALFRSMNVIVGDDEKDFSWSTTKFCFVLPYLASVDCDDISNYEEDMYGLFTESLFRLTPGTTSIGLGYDETLCGETVDLSRGLNYDVYECVTKDVANYPFPYPYHNVYLNVSGGYEERDNSPFNTTTPCCIDNAIAPTSTVCYESPIECNNKLQVVKSSYCDGVRGNLCGTDEIQTIQRSTDNIALCGTDCGTHELCAGQEQFSYQTDVEGKKYLCTGTSGCDQVTENLVVSSDRLATGKSWRDELQNTDVAMLESLGLYVGCVENGNNCDSDSDGILDGVCADGVCS